MKLDNWTLFNLPQSDRQLIEAYSGPENEASLLKDVPIHCLDIVFPTIRRIESLSGKKCRVIYRGPRPDGHHQSMTRKADAVRFALYFR
jgi:hypothetical protein